MKILVFFPFSKSTTHLATAFEITEKHIQEGDQVHAVTCNAELLSCYVNINHRAGYCRECIYKKNKAFSALSKKIDENPILNLANINLQKSYILQSNFTSIDELRHYKIDNFDIGYGALSSLISATLIAEPDINKNKKLLDRLFYSSYLVYLSTLQLLKKNQFKRVYIYNGRFSNFRAVVRACELLGVEYYTYESGSTINKYALYKNSMPHNMKKINDAIFDMWNNDINFENKFNIAKKFYEDRCKGIIYNWYSFTSNQTPNELPSNWNQDKCNIVIYFSSEHEFKSISDEWDLPFYKDQIDGVYQIYNSMIKYKNKYHIYVRLHPYYTPNRVEIIRDNFSSLDSDFLTVIPNDSKISSYSMLFKGDIIVTFGSTIGIEAVYWNKPSILAGNSLYRNLGGTYNPNTHDELINLLLNNISPKDIEPALMFGYYASTFGIDYNYYIPEKLTSGMFKSTRVELENNKISKSLIKYLKDSIVRKFIDEIFIIYTYIKHYRKSIIFEKMIRRLLF